MSSTKQPLDPSSHHTRASKRTHRSLEHIRRSATNQLKGKYNHALNVFQKFDTADSGYLTPYQLALAVNNLRLGLSDTQIATLVKGSQITDNGMVGYHGFLDQLRSTSDCSRTLEPRTPSQRRSPSKARQAHTPTFAPTHTPHQASTPTSTHSPAPLERMSVAELTSRAKERVGRALKQRGMTGEDLAHAFQTVDSQQQGTLDCPAFARTLRASLGGAASQSWLSDTDLSLLFLDADGANSGQAHYTPFCQELSHTHTHTPAETAAAIYKAPSPPLEERGGCGCSHTHTHPQIQAPAPAPARQPPVQMAEERGGRGAEKEVSKARRVVVDKVQQRSYDLHRLFTHLDTTRTGTLSHTGFKQALKTLRVPVTQDMGSKLLHFADPQRTGQITFERFAQCFGSHDATPPPPTHTPTQTHTHKSQGKQVYDTLCEKLHGKYRILPSVFGHYDLDKTNQITHYEFRQALGRLGVCLNESDFGSLVGYLDSKQGGSRGGVIRYDEITAAMRGVNERVSETAHTDSPAPPSPTLTHSTLHTHTPPTHPHPHTHTHATQRQHTHPPTQALSHTPPPPFPIETHHLNEHTYIHTHTPRDTHLHTPSAVEIELPDPDSPPMHAHTPTHTSTPHPHPHPHAYVPACRVLPHQRSEVGSLVHGSAESPQTPWVVDPNSPRRAQSAPRLRPRNPHTTAGYPRRTNRSFQGSGDIVAHRTPVNASREFHHTRKRHTRPLEHRQYGGCLGGEQVRRSQSAPRASTRPSTTDAYPPLPSLTHSPPHTPKPTYKRTSASLTHTPTPTPTRNLPNYNPKLGPVSQHIMSRLKGRSNLLKDRLQFYSQGQSHVSQHEFHTALKEAKIVLSKPEKRILDEHFVQKETGRVHVEGVTKSVVKHDLMASRMEFEKRGMRVDGMCLPGQRAFGSEQTAMFPRKIRVQGPPSSISIAGPVPRQRSKSVPPRPRPSTTDLLMAGTPPLHSSQFRNLTANPHARPAPHPHKPADHHILHPPPTQHTHKHMPSTCHVGGPTQVQKCLINAPQATHFVSPQTRRLRNPGSASPMLRQARQGTRALSVDMSDSGSDTGSDRAAGLDSGHCRRSAEVNLYPSNGPISVGNRSFVNAHQRAVPPSNNLLMWTS